MISSLSISRNSSQLHAPQRDVRQPADGRAEEAAEVEAVQHHPCHRQKMRQVNWSYSFNTIENHLNARFCGTDL